MKAKDWKDMAIKVKNELLLRPKHIVGYGKKSISFYVNDAGKLEITGVELPIELNAAQVVELMNWLQATFLAAEEEDEGEFNVG